MRPAKTGCRVSRSIANAASAHVVAKRHNLGAICGKKKLLPLGTRASLAEASVQGHLRACACQQPARAPPRTCTTPAAPPCRPLIKAPAAAFERAPVVPLLRTPSARSAQAGRGARSARLEQRGSCRAPARPARRERCCQPLHPVRANMQSVLCSSVKFCGAGPALRPPARASVRWPPPVRREGRAAPERHAAVGEGALNAGSMA